MDAIQVQEFLNQLTETKLVSLKQVRERLSKVLLWDKRELPLTRTLRLIQNPRDDEEKFSLKGFWTASEANMNARADLLLAAIGRS